MSEKIMNFFRNDISDLSEYKIFDSNGMVKLDAMENPYDLNIKFV